MVRIRVPAGGGGPAGTWSSTGRRRRIISEARTTTLQPTSGLLRRYGGSMANEHGQLPPRIRLQAGTAFKAGFCGAFGVLVFSLLLSLVVGVTVLVLAALNVLPGVA